MILTETAIEAAARGAELPPTTVQEANMGAETMPVWKELERKMGGRAQRQAAVTAFNKANRWRKRGLYSIPVKYARGNREREMVTLQINKTDGVVEVTTSGIEMGQGLNTKVAQAVAMSLSKGLSSTATIPIAMVKNTGLKSTADFPAASGTSGSGTSESCCDAAFKACGVLLKRLGPYLQSGAPWLQVVQAAAAAGVDLTAGIEGRHTGACSHITTSSQPGINSWPY